jgi:hypothetical protein
MSVVTNSAMISPFVLILCTIAANGTSNPFPTRAGYAGVIEEICSDLSAQ